MDWKGPYGAFAESRTYTIIYWIPQDADPLDMGGIAGALRAEDGSREFTIYSSAVRGNRPGQATPQGLVVHIPAGFILEFQGTFGEAFNVTVSEVR